MPAVIITQESFLKDPQGKTFSDVVQKSPELFEAVVKFFSDENRQRRMEESEIHHDRAPLAGVVRELESLKEVNGFLSTVHPRRSMRFRQSVGVVVRIIMEGRGWDKTGRKGSLGVRAESQASLPAHNSGGLSFWFSRAERYQSADKSKFENVKERSEKIVKTKPRSTKKSKSPSQ